LFYLENTNEHNIINSSSLNASRFANKALFTNLVTTITLSAKALTRPAAFSHVSWSCTIF
jgi:hypothetical protein